MPTMNELKCKKCGEPISKHQVFHDQPTPEQLATRVEADFGDIEVHGMYCP